MSIKKLGSIKLTEDILVGSTNLASEVTGILGVANGGTGQSVFTNGQLLIGNTTGNTLTKATLTAGSGISITNGAGSISIAATAVSSQWTTSGSNIYYTGGNVGIGSSSPDTNLQVNNHIHVGSQTTWSNPGGWNATTTLDGLYHGRYRIIGSAFSGGKNTQTESYFWVDNTYAPYSGIDSGAGFRINVTSGYHAYITGGNLSIGTTVAPVYPLDVNGSARLWNSSGNALLYLDKGGGSAYEAGLYFQTAGSNRWEIYTRASNDSLNFYGFGTATSTLTLEYANGNVGVNIVSPEDKLHVVGNLRLGNSSNANITFDTASNWLYYLQATGDDFFWRDAENVNFYASYYNGGSTGKYASILGTLNTFNNSTVRIGTTTASTVGSFTNTRVLIKQIADGTTGGGLHIEQSSNTNVAYFGFTGTDFRIGTSYRSTGSYQPIKISTGATPTVTISTGGYVGIGTESPSDVLHVVGNSRATGYVRAYQNAVSTGYMELASGSSGAMVPTLFGLSEGSTVGNYWIVNRAANIPSLTGWSAGAFRITSDFSLTSGLLLNVENYYSSRFVVDYNGNTTIGTSSTPERLYVYSNTDARQKIRIVNDSAGSSARAELVVNAYGNSWGIGMGSSANNSNAFYIREDSNSADTQRITMLTGGNVGVGITSPSALMHVANLSSNNNAYQHIQYLTANNSTEASGESYSGTASYGLGFRRQWSGSTFTNLAGIYAFGSGGWRGGLLFRTKDNTSSSGEPDINALYLSPTGYVGINTTSPAERLHVTGGPTMTGGWNRSTVLEATYPVLVFNSNGSRWAGIGYDFSGTQYGLTFWTYSSNENVSGNGTFAFRVQNDGVVYVPGSLGVGTAAPGAKLDVVSGTSGTAFRTVGESGRIMYFGTDGGGQYIEINGTSAANRVLRIQAYDGSSAYNQFFINANGKTYTNAQFGLGHTSPDCALSVSGVVHIGNGGNFVYMGGNAGSTGSWGSRHYTTSGNNVNNANTFTFDNVGYGSTWTVTFNSSGVTAKDFILSSDRRRKTELVRISDALAKVLAWAGYTYRPIDGERRRAGLMAQDVEANAPEVVYTDDDGWKSMSYEQTIPYLVEAIRDLHRMIEALA